jgi:hypothetical protein
VNSLRIEKWNKIARGKEFEAINPTVYIMTVKDQCTRSSVKHNYIYVYIFFNLY